MVLESSGRRLLTFVPLLRGARTQSVVIACQVAACSTVFDQTFLAGAFVDSMEAPVSAHIIFAQLARGPPSAWRTRSQPQLGGGSMRKALAGGG